MMDLIKHLEQNCWTCGAGIEHSFIILVYVNNDTEEAQKNFISK